MRLFVLSILICAFAAPNAFALGSKKPSVDQIKMASAAAKRPKYGQEATLLSKSHEYIRESEAPDYWALSPYYTAQQDERSCSVAAVTMLMNAARQKLPLTTDDELVTQKTLLSQVNNDAWKEDVGSTGHGVSLEELKVFVEASLKAYGFKNFTVEVVHTPDRSQATFSKMHQALVANEKSSDDFILANFLQGVYTGDADVGHIAPVAAYDQKRQRVLILDPDRLWYEPYWVSEKTFLAGMATHDKTSGFARGYLWAKIRRPGASPF